MVSNMYGLVFLDGLLIKTDNTAYQALVLVWLWCGKNEKLIDQKDVADAEAIKKENEMLISIIDLIIVNWEIRRSYE